MDTRLCPDCGAPISTAAAGGACPACLLRLGETSGEDSTILEESSRGEEGSAEIPEAAFLLEQPGQRIGRYKLLERIGEGGFGTVWMAEQEEPVRRRVALKIIKAGMDTREVVARFDAERQALAMMDHPNIARVFDGGATDRGRPFFVMELVRGLPVTTYCDRARLSLRERLELFVTVCQAVQHAHQKGVIHRDLKPSNVLVTDQDGRAAPKVIDFGIAKATEVRLTEKTLLTGFNQFIGTPAYMSPEQAGLGGLDIDTRSDVYSLGVLLYELLTGQTPFDGRKLREAGYEVLLKTIREVEPPRPSTRLAALPLEQLTILATQRREDPAKLQRFVRGELDWILLKALEKDRGRRYETANGLAGDLARFLRDEPVMAAPPGLGYQLAKFSRRNRVALATVAAFVLVMAIGAGLSVWQAVRATRLAVAEQRQGGIARTARREAESSFEVMRENLYAADVSLAQRALAEGNLGLARQALAAHRPQAPIPPADPAAPASRPLQDLRGFEWRYLWAQTGGDQLAILLGHTNAVSGLAFSSDGQTLVSGGADCTVRFWDVGRQELKRTFSTTTNDIVSLALSRSEKEVVTVSGDGMVKRWGMPSGELVFTYQPQVGIVTLAPSLTRYATAAFEEGGAQVKFSRLNGAATECVLKNGQGRVAFAHDDRRVALAGDSEISLWQIARTQCLQRAETTIRMDGLRFSAGDRWLAGWSARSRDLFLWEGAQIQFLGRCTGHTGKVLDAAFSPDEMLMASAGADQSVRVWDLAARRELACWRGHESEVRAVAFSPDGRFLASAGKDGTIRLWPVRPTDPPFPEITNAYPPYAWSGDGGTLAALAQPAPSDGAPAGLWNVPFVVGEEGRWQGTPASHFKGQPFALMHDLVHGGKPERRDLGAFVPAFFDLTGTNLMVCRRSSSSRTLHLGPVIGGQAPVETIELKGSRDAHRASLVSVDGRTVVVATATGRVRVHDLTNGALLRELGETDPRQPVLQLSREGRWLATFSSGAGVGVWEIATGTLVTRLQGVPGPLLGLAFSQDGQTLATAGANDEIGLWDLPSGRMVARLRGHGEPVLQVAFAPDGLTLASSSADGTVKLWSLRTRRELATLAHDLPLTWLAFSKDGLALAGGSARGRLKIWRAPALSRLDADFAATRGREGRTTRINQ